MGTLKLGTFLLMSFLSLMILSGVAVASGQDSINELIKNGGNINLSGTYTLTGPIMLSSDLKLNGQNLTTITIPDDANWSVWVPLIKGEGLHNITIEGIEFNANADGNDETPHGKGYYNCIHLIDCKNITVRNCIFHDGKGDGLRVKYCNNVKFYNNIAYKLGHDCFYAIDSEGVLAWNNDLTTRTNSGLRLWNSKDAEFFCNRINAQPNSLGGNPGIQIEDSKGTMENIRVFANTIYETWGAGIWLISYDSGTKNDQNIIINYNRILKDGVSYNIAYTSGITIDGVKGTNISNNVFDGCNNAGILVLDGGQDTNIQKNIITNTCKHPAISQSGTGYGIVDRLSADIYVLNNCFFNNTNGDVFQAESDGNDLQNPTKHNTSSGWRWDGSKWLCDYVITLENYTIDNSTFEYNNFGSDTNYTGSNETNYTGANETNSTGFNDTDLHEIIFVPVKNTCNNTCNNTCSSKNVTGCNKSIVKCRSICDVPLITTIIGCINKTKTNSCTTVEQTSVNVPSTSSCGNGSSTSSCGNGSDTSSCGNGSITSTCEELEYKLVFIDNSQTDIDSIYNSYISTSVDSNSAISDKNISTRAQQQDSTSKMSGAGSPCAENISFNKTDISNIYSANGTYNVPQTVTNPNNTLTFNTLINANTTSILTPSVAESTATTVSGSLSANTQSTPVTPVQLTADFDADSTSGVDSLTVHFTDKSTGAIYWQWNFGDNSPLVTTKNVEHSFGVGTWNVNLKVSDGTNIASKSVVITVTEKPKSPIANFTVDRTSGESPLEVQFTDKSSNAVSYEWNFGDGVTSTDMSPSHTYSAEGNYYVTLNVTGINGDKSTSCAIITVSKPQTNSAGTVDLNSNSTPLKSS